MPNLVVSAHGGRYAAPEPTLTVPDGSQVVFYVTDGGYLAIDEGEQILKRLQQGTEPGGHVVQRIFEGGRTYDYACWFAPEFAADCGLYAVRSPIPLDNLRRYTPAAPLQLSTILTTYPNRVVYWDCCRTVSAAGEPLHDPPEAHPELRPA